MMKSVFLAATMLALSSNAHADTLVDNIKGETIAADGSLQTFGALLFDDAGIIKAVYGPGARVPKQGRNGYQYHIDGKGRVLLPGMIDAHAHVMQTGFALLTLDLSDTVSLEDALDRIGKFAKAHPDRPWIMGSGWNQERWHMGRFPTAAELDRVVPDRPVWLERADFHAGWANSAALKAAGITAATPTPDGGAIDRLPDHSPAGVLVDHATDMMTRAIPAPLPRDLDLALATAEADFAKRGITAVADMGISVNDWIAFRRAGDGNHLYVRIMAYALGTEAMAQIGGSGPTPWLYADKLRMGGLKLLLDGALGSRGAWLKAPYSDQPGTSGTPLYSETQLGNLMSRAAMDNYQVAVHAIGDKANETLLTTIYDLTHTYKGDRRWRIEHAQIVDPKNWPLVAEIAHNGGVVASMQPVHMTSDGRSPPGPRPPPRRLRMEQPETRRRSPGLRIRHPRRTPRPMDRHRRRTNPPGRNRRPRRRLATARTRRPPDRLRRLHQRSRLGRFRRNQIRPHRTRPARRLHPGRHRPDDRHPRSHPQNQGVPDLGRRRQDIRRRA